MLVEEIIPKLAYKIIPKDAADFIVKDYLPELRVATKDIELSHADKHDLVAKFSGMLMKLLYAFTWQEHFIPLPALYKHESAIRMGAWLLPHWNALATKISGFPQTDADVNAAKNVYPGDFYCQGYSPHAIWHEESANGLLELVFLANSVNGILSK